jgi:hypothetical protein
MNGHPDSKHSPGEVEERSDVLSSGTIPDWDVKSYRAQDNPLFNQLMQRQRVLSSSRTRIISLLVGFVGIAAMAGPLYSGSLTLLSAASLLVIIPSVALIITAVFSGRYADENQRALLRLTHVTSAQMLRGYVDAAIEQGKWLRSLSIGFGLQGGIALFFAVGTDLVGCDPLNCGSEYAFFFLICGLPPALVIAGVLTALSLRLLRLATDTGVWLGINWGGQAAGVAVAISVAYLIALVLLCWVLILNFFVFAPLVLTCASPLIILGIDWLARIVIKQTQNALS